MNESQTYTGPHGISYTGPHGIQAQANPVMTSEQVHEFRKKIDALIQELNCYGKTRESSLAYTKLQESKMWLGKVLEMMGNILPPGYADKADVPAEDCAAISQQN